MTHEHYKGETDVRCQPSLISGLALMLALIMANAALVHAQSLEETVRSVARSFGEALTRGDSVAALALLHPEVLIFEDGRAETKEQYSRAHIRADIAFASAVRMETLRDTVIVHGDLAVYARDYRARGRHRDREVDFTATETMVLVRMPDGWRILHIRWP